MIPTDPFEHDAAGVRDVNAGNRTKRAAHRPSRRAVVVEAAMRLFAMRPIENVRVADVAAEAKMTSAAVYYHFSSKEEVLLAGLRDFAGHMLAQLGEQIEAGHEVAPGDLIVATLKGIEARRSAAVVYFVRSPGWSGSIEELRREVRLAVIAILVAHLQVHRDRESRAEQVATATALSSLLEVAAASALTEDGALVILGRRRFFDEVRELADDIVAR